MASYQARQRDPLLDQNTQAMIERRGKELLGLALIGAGGADGDAAGQLFARGSELDGRDRRAGAEPARPLRRRHRLAALRHRRPWRLGRCRWSCWPGGCGLSRIVARTARWAARSLPPIAVALLARSMPRPCAGPGWAHSFGLGGLFGDTVLGAMLGVVPISASARAEAAVAAHRRRGAGDDAVRPRL